MITISVYKQGNYPVAASKIKKAVKETLEKEGVVSDFDVSVALVGKDKMDELVTKYYKEDPKGEYEHPVLTFVTLESKGTFVNPEKKVDLGEIIISYPSAVEESKETGKLVEEVVLELAKHGSYHLVGIHH